MIDIGVNLTNKRFKVDLEQVIQRAREVGVIAQVVTGTDLLSSQAACKLAESFPGYLYSTAGVHPHHADEWNHDLAQGIINIFEDPSVVAVGETGLDFNRNFSTPQNQLSCFEHQLQIAVQLQKPVFLHERDAHVDFINILSRYRQEIPNAVVHCFTGNRQQLRAYLDLDCYIGITGWVCDERRGYSMHEFIDEIPDERLMIETDAPYLLPRNLENKPKSARNEPAFLPYIAKTLANIRTQSVETISELSRINAKRFFSI